METVHGGQLRRLLADVRFARGLQVAAAGAGFWFGYVSFVVRWGSSLGWDGVGVNPSGLQSALAGGAALAAVYALLVGIFFWQLLPVPRAQGLRVCLSPAVFTGSALLGFFGLRLALTALALG